MIKLLILFGVALAIFITAIYIIVLAYKKYTKPKPTMTNNEYDNYPNDKEN
jgi:hypothetical protein